MNLELGTTDAALIIEWHSQVGIREQNSSIEASIIAGRLVSRADDEEPEANMSDIPPSEAFIPENWR